MEFLTHHFVEIAVLMGIAAIIALAMRLLRQPLIIGHILTGLLVGPFVLNLVQSAETLRLFGELGIAFLLFSVGLGLSPHVLRTFGRVAVVTGLGQVIFTTLAGIGICLALGFNLISAIYISIALAFSSTIIILKLISDRGDLDKLYAKIAIGFLLVQDIIAVILLFAIPIISTEGGSLITLLTMAAKGIALAAVVLLIAKYGIARLNNYLANTQELLFLFANAWGMVIAGLFLLIGFSLESGALIAGIALATLPTRHEIASRLLPLKDFFIVVFFIYLGSQMALGDITSVIGPAIILSLLVLIGNPLILMVIMGWLGYRKKTSLFTGLTVAQISEFSLILIALGVRLGHLEGKVLSLVTLVGLITICGSTYFFIYGDTIYRFLSRYLTIFERKTAHEISPTNEQYDTILFGAGRVGTEFVELFTRQQKKLLVIEHDPEVLSRLNKQGIDTEYGDGSDIALLEDIDMRHTSLIVSTIPEVEANMVITRYAKRINPDIRCIAVAHHAQEALTLYDAGIDYVILPHVLGARYAAKLTEQYSDQTDQLADLRSNHVRSLQEDIARGDDHRPGHKRLVV